MLNKQAILKLSRETSISTATLTQLLEVLLYNDAQLSRFGKSIESLFAEINDKMNSQQDSLFEALSSFTQSLRTPQKLYTLRINPKYLKKTDSKNKLSSLLNKNLNVNSSAYEFDPKIPNVVYIKSNGPNQLDLLNKRITVDRYASESVMIGANLYIPGFNKTPYDFEKNQNVSIYGPGDFHVANGITQIHSNELLTVKNGLGIETTNPLFSLPRYRDTELYSNGIISDQTFSPNIACWSLMSYYTGEEQILDMCSAPGHKTCSLSEIGYYLTGEYPKLFSVDRSKNRLRSLHEDIPRLGLENVTVIQTKIKRLKDKHPELIGANDLVVLDPPCSALGTRPKLMIEHSWEDFRSFFLLQRSFFKLIDEFVKSGGYLLYNTCTMTLLENECVISYVLDKMDYELVPIRSRINKILPERFPTENGFFTTEEENNTFGFELKTGIPRNEVINQYLLELNKTSKNFIQFSNIADIEKYHTLKKSDANKLGRTYPHSMNTTGYFMALLKKK